MCIYMCQYIISSLQVPTKMAKIGTWRIITNTVEKREFREYKLL